MSAAVTAFYFAAACSTTALAGGSFYAARQYMNYAWHERALIRYLVLFGIVVPATTVALGMTFVSLACWYAFFKA